MKQILRCKKIIQAKEKIVIEDGHGYGGCRGLSHFVKTRSTREQSVLDLLHVLMTFMIFEGVFAIYTESKLYIQIYGYAQKFNNKMYTHLPCLPTFGH